MNWLWSIGADCGLMARLTEAGAELDFESIALVVEAAKQLVLVMIVLESC